MADTKVGLRKLLEIIAIKNNYKNYKINVAPASSGGSNYSSQLYRITISGEHEDDLQLFAKVASMGEKFREVCPLKIYDIEKLAYTKLLKLYQELEEAHQIPEEHRTRYPKFYGYDSTWLQETIVLEDLQSKGFVMHDRFKSVSWPYAESAITELAKYHALSMALEKEKPEDFKQFLEDVAEVDTEELCPTHEHYKNATNMALEAAKDHPQERKLRKFLVEGPWSSLKDAFWTYTGPIKRTVICHRDFRPCNMLHKLHDDGRVEVIPVDYQTLQPSSPVVDLLYFIFTGSDEEFRSKYYERLVDHYYTELSAALRRLHLDPDQIYSREDYEFELKEKLPFGLSVAVFALPTVTVDPENAPKVDKDMDLSSLTAVKTSKVFRERLNGIINDFVKWGIL